MFGNYNYSYAVRPPTMRRSSVRKKPFESNQQVTIIPDNNDFLCHFGILGQKWGVRRYQNEDGTYTEEGKKRYGRDSAPESETWKKSDAETLSDEELRRRNTRLQAERQYRDLTTSEVEKERTQFTKGIKQDAIRKILIGGAISLAAVAMKKNYAKVGPLVAKYGRTLMSKIKTSKLLKGGLLKNSRRYTSPTGPANAGKVIGQNDSLVRNLKNKLRPHTFNYRPKAVNGSLPRQQNWPDIGNYFRKK